MSEIFENGKQFWRDTKENHGFDNAWKICRNYIDMQIREMAHDGEEMSFCEGCYEEMHRDDEHVADLRANVLRKRFGSNAFYEDCIEREYGEGWIEQLRRNHLIESCGVLEGRKLYTL